MQLPQYRDSAFAMELFLDAIHDQDQPLQRSTNVPGSVKWADGSEIAAEKLSYFQDQKGQLEHEFLVELSDRIGEAKAFEFCHTVAVDWFSGAKGRRGPRVSGLKAAVREYVVALIKPSELKDVVILDQQDLPAAMLSALDVARILQLNHELLYKHLEAWKAVHPNADCLSSDDIFLRRGLGLDQAFEEHDVYRELDFINSYSLAFSSPEKFAQMQKNKVAAIVNGDLALFDHRVLFFSPFVPGMMVGQLELGIIPALKALPLKSQGEHAGIQEYLLDPRPFDHWEAAGGLDFE
ncbi:hypothetical protein [Cupriavidus sp. IK-TO18]|uniref:hypothetical protein n=1 Tax=Cupriavidus sp. IK-TO18 TaxID=2782182 RepID=UPI00189AC49F|nr:hypothetical protein [Cupriavidus sp. IK-TO18]MBF6990776.1 hypothetical protein [Cupriavidus sp. IK-TO18]